MGKTVPIIVNRKSAALKSPSKVITKRSSSSPNSSHPMSPIVNAKQETTNAAGLSTTGKTTQKVPVASTSHTAKARQKVPPVASTSCTAEERQNTVFNLSPLFKPAEPLSATPTPSIQMIRLPVPIYDNEYDDTWEYTPIAPKPALAPELDRVGIARYRSPGETFSVGKWNDPPKRVRFSGNIRERFFYYEKRPTIITIHYRKSEPTTKKEPKEPTKADLTRYKAFCDAAKEKQKSEVKNKKATPRRRGFLTRDELEMKVIPLD